jgi:hypothetical protein
MGATGLREEREDLSQSRKERKGETFSDSLRLCVLARKKPAQQNHFHRLRVNEVHERLR